MYLKKVIVLVMAVVLTIGSKGTLVNAGHSFGCSFNLLYAHKEAKGTYNSANAFWNSSLVVSGSVATARVAFDVSLVHVNARIEAYGIDKNKTANWRTTSDDSAGSAAATVSFTCHVEKATASYIVGQSSVSALEIQ